MRRIWGWVAFLVVLVLVGVVVSRSHGKATPAASPARAGVAGAARRRGAVTSVTVAKAVSGELTAALSLTGTVSPVDSVQINPQASGVVASLKADVGTHVTAGQVLATLNDSGVAESNTAQAKAQLAQAELQLQKYENPAAFVTQSSITQAELSVDNAKASLQQQQDALTSAQQAVNITAPGAGDVEVVNVTLGAAVGQGQALLQVIAPNSPVLVMAEVPQTATVATGETVSVLVPALSTTTAGTVTAVGTGAAGASTTGASNTSLTGKGATLVNPPGQAGYINVQITLGNPPSGLHDGMTAQVGINVPEAGGLTQIVQAAGTIQYQEDWIVTAPSSGSLATLSVKPGDAVTVGEVVGTISAPALQAAIDRAQVAVSQAQTSLKQAESSLRALQSPDPSPQATIDAQKQVVAEMQAALSLREQQVTELTIKAPFDGTIQARDVSVGATVSPASPLFTLVGSGVNVQVPVPQGQAGAVKVGDVATIEPQDGRPALTGHVTSLAPAASSQSLTFTAYVAPDAPAPGLMPGGAVSVTIVTAKVPGALGIPASTVQTINGRDQVYVVRNSVVALVPVQVGASGLMGSSPTVMTQVTSGVRPGDEVVTSDTTYLAPGDRVVVTGAGAPAAPHRATGSGTARRATSSATAGH